MLRRLLLTTPITTTTLGVCVDPSKPLCIVTDYVKVVAALEAVELELVLVVGAAGGTVVVEQL